MLYRAKD